MSDVNISQKTASFVELNQQIESQISKVQNAANSPEQGKVLRESKAAISSILEEMNFALSDSELKKQPISKDEAVSTLQLLQRIETVAKGDLEGPGKVLLSSLMTKLNGLITENITHTTKPVVNQPVQEALSTNGKVVGPVMDSTKINLGLVDGLEAMEKERPVVPKQFDIDFTAPSYSRLDRALNWIKNIFAAIFGGTGKDLTKDELKARVHEFGMHNGRLLWEIKESASFERVVSDLLEKAMDDSDCPIPPAEREAEIKEYVAILEKAQQEWFDEIYGDFNGQKLSELPIDSELGRLVHYDLMTMAVSYVMQGKVDEACKECLSVENLTKLPVEYKLAAKTRVLGTLKSICESGAYGSDPLHNPSLVEVMIQVTAAELVDAINIHKAGQQGDILAEPETLDSTDDKIQFIVSQVSQKISDPIKFIEVLSQLGIDSPLQTGNVDEYTQLDNDEELRRSLRNEQMHGVFKRMTTRQVLHFTAGLQSENMRLLSRKVHHQKQPGHRKLPAALREQRHQVVQDEILGLQNAFTMYAKSETFTAQLQQFIEENKDDASILEKIANLQSFCKGEELADNDQKVTPVVVARVNVAFREDGKREINRQVKRISKQLSNLATDTANRQKSILSSFVAEIAAMNASFRASKLEQSEREEFADMLVDMLLKSINEHYEEKLLEKLAFLMIQDEFGTDFSEVMDEVFTVTKSEDKTASDFDRYVASKVVRTISAIYKVK